MAINKVVYGNQTLVDLTSDTVTPEKLMSGETAHNAAGGQITGTASPGPTYTAGDGIDITNNAISVNTTFTEASTRANIASGDTFSTILGKIKKWFSDLTSMFVSKTGDTMSGLLTIKRNAELQLALTRDHSNTTVQETRIGIGNQTPNGTAGASYGAMTLWGDGAYGAELQARNMTANRTHQLPDASGTIALTSDIPDISTKVSKSGDTMTGQLKMFRDSENQIFVDRNNTGTASQVANVQIGNGTADGTAGSTYGRLRLMGKGTNCTDLQASNSTANRTIELPNASGTIALTSDIPDISGKVNKSGDVMTGTLKITNGYGIEVANNSVSTMIVQPAAAGAVVHVIETPNASGTMALKSDVSAKVSKSGDYMSGNLYIGSDGAGGYLNGSASNGGCNSIMVGDDVWLGDVDAGGILGMKSTGNDCGFQFKKSNGNNIGKLYSNNGTLKFDSNTIIHSGNIGSQSVSSATTSTKDDCPRVENKNLNNSSNINGGVSTAKFSECGPSCTNLPDANWYFILSMGSADSNYGAQLAIGMTTEYCWVRRKDGGGWGSWRRLV